MIHAETEPQCWTEETRAGDGDEQEIIDNGRSNNYELTGNKSRTIQFYF